MTVKDKIVYEQIDVADEVKKESEINTLKEDTAVHQQASAAPKDTVQSVDPETGGGCKTAATPMRR